MPRGRDGSDGRIGKVSTRRALRRTVAIGTHPLAVLRRHSPRYFYIFFFTFALEAELTGDLSGVWKYDGEPYGGRGARSAAYSVSFTKVLGEARRRYRVSGGPCAAGCDARVDGATITVDFPNSRLNATVGAGFGTMQFSNGVEWTKSREESCDGLATITMAGAASVWWGVGFDTDNMADKPYTIVVDGKGTVTERRMGDHEERHSRQ